MDACAGRLRPADRTIRLGALILEPLDGEHREQGVAPGYGRGQLGFGDLAIVAIAATAGFVQELAPDGDIRLGRGPGLRDHERPLVGRMRRDGQRDGHDADLAPEYRGSARRQRTFRVWPGLVAADEDVSRPIQEVVEGPRQPGLRPIGLARHPVDADVIGLEERAKAIVIHLRDRVVLVVVTAGALHRYAEERARRVLDRVRQPDIAIEDVPVARQEPGGAEDVGVVRGQLVARQHLEHHAVIALVGVERLDDPVAPAPQVRVAEADFLAEAVPIAIPPDVHTVPAPAFAVTARWPAGGRPCARPHRVRHPHGRNGSPRASAGDRPGRA